MEKRVRPGVLGTDEKRTRPAQVPRRGKADPDLVLSSAFGLHRNRSSKVYEAIHATSIQTASRFIGCTSSDLAGVRPGQAVCPRRSADA
jgi:hypothetical protein